LGISTKSLYGWIKQYSKPENLRVQETEQAWENRRLKAELTRVTEERDILKKAMRTSQGKHAKTFSILLNYSIIQNESITKIECCLPSTLNYSNMWNYKVS